MNKTINFYRLYWYMRNPYTETKPIIKQDLQSLPKLGIISFRYTFDDKSQFYRLDDLRSMQQK